MGFSLTICSRMSVISTDKQGLKMIDENGTSDPTNMTNEEAVELVGRFLSKEWKYLNSEDISILRLQ